MKKNICLVLTFLFTVLLFSQTVPLKFKISNGAEYEVYYNENQRILSFSDKSLPFLDEVEDFAIVDISGLDKLKHLEILEIKDILNYVNYGFINDLSNICELYINSCFVDSLSFLENLYNLEVIDIQIYVTEESAQKIKNTKIDLSNLLFIKRIDFKATVISADEQLIPYNSIPFFVNVQNQPVLNIGGNDISDLSVNQRNLLKQYSEIYLYPNPILFDDLQMESLTELNIIKR